MAQEDLEFHIRPAFFSDNPRLEPAFRTDAPQKLWGFYPSGVTLASDYPIEEEPNIKEFLLKRSSSVEGPYRAVETVKRDQRKIEFQVSFDPGTTSSFYVVVAIVGDTDLFLSNFDGIRWSSL
jgi:hypothetical protein